MELLKNQGNFKILATWPSAESNENAQMVLEKAGRTCYQSEKGLITPETSSIFISKCMKRTHFSVIEHGWRGYDMCFNTVSELNKCLRYWYPATKFMFFTFDKFNNYIMKVSANLETWRKLYKKGKLHKTIKEDLQKFAPSIFVSNENVSDLGLACYVEAIETIEDLKNDEEIVTHVAHTVQYNNHSRGFTHELVRHRIPVFSQESTRYVDESDFRVIIPPQRDEKSKHTPGGKTYSKIDDTRVKLLEYFEDIGYSLEDWCRLNSEMYRTLRFRGWPAEDARQVLPTAIAAQIVMTCCLSERRYIYFRRTASAAHWEIRTTMCNELKYMQSLYPDLFKMFVYQDKPARDGVVGYCDVNELADFFCDEI